MTAFNSMDVFQWIRERLSPNPVPSTQFIYDDLISQSGKSLPVIYQPFDADKPGHWADRGSLYDFLHSTQGWEKKVLDFGPGDGWPSLIIAPHVGQVIGLDGSARRVAVCTENAKRLGITNAYFQSYTPGEPLPFADHTFDAIMAASSIEQTPDPRATLEELYRVLKPGGRLRMHYEALNMYRNGREKDLWLTSIDRNYCRLILTDRHIDEEYVDDYGITFNFGIETFKERLGSIDEPEFKDITVQFLETLMDSITAANVCRTIHPSGATFSQWLQEVGFSHVFPTHSGNRAAHKLFSFYDRAHRPSTLHEVDAVVEPLVQIVCELPAPLTPDPRLTAVK